MNVFICPKKTIGMKSKKTDIAFKRVKLKEIIHLVTNMESDITNY